MHKSMYAFVPFMQFTNTYIHFGVYLVFVWLIYLFKPGKIVADLILDFLPLIIIHF